jgi:hypothetical protein
VGDFIHGEPMLDEQLINTSAKYESFDDSRGEGYWVINFLKSILCQCQMIR